MTDKMPDLDESYHKCHIHGINMRLIDVGRGRHRMSAQSVAKYDGRLLRNFTKIICPKAMVIFSIGERDD
jgi:hypothetical protein